MISEQDFKDSTQRKRNDMAKRLKPRYWKSGARAGTLRIPGRQLPFTLGEFRAWADDRIGLGTVPCYYCPRPIDVLSFQPDHYVPVELGGSFGLENLVASCEDCNRLKGAMPPQDFKALLKLLDTLSQMGRNDLTKRLRAGAMGLRLRFHPHAKPSSNALKTPQKTTTYQFDLDDF